MSDKSGLASSFLKPNMDMTAPLAAFILAPT